MRYTLQPPTRGRPLARRTLGRRYRPGGQCRPAFHRHAGACLNARQQAVQSLQYISVIRESSATGLALPLSPGWLRAHRQPAPAGHPAGRQTAGRQPAARQPAGRQLAGSTMTSGSSRAPGHRSQKAHLAPQPRAPRMCHAPPLPPNGRLPLLRQVLPFLQLRPGWPPAQLPATAPLASAAAASTMMVATVAAAPAAAPAAAASVRSQRRQEHLSLPWTRRQSHAIIG